MESLFCSPLAEFNHVMAAQPRNQFRGSTGGDNLSVVNDGEAIAQTFGLFHIVRGQQHGAAAFLKSANNVPKLAAALGIESGGGLVQKQDLRIAHQGGGYGEPLPLTPDNLPTLRRLFR